MIAYLVLLFAVLSRLLPPAIHATGLGFTAVGGGLLFFGAHRSRWQTLFAVVALMATDYYLTAIVYGLQFHARGYAVTWLWYAAICLFGHQFLGNKVEGKGASAFRVTAAVFTSATSFFLLSNFVVWTGSHMYAHTFAGLGTCYVAAIPFYANDVISTAITAGALFGLPALARNLAETLRDLRSNQPLT